MFKLTAIVVFVASLIGCGTEPGALPTCSDSKPLADTYTYACSNGTRRCTFANGMTRYSGCMLDEGTEQVECVSTCD